MENINNLNNNSIGIEIQNKGHFKLSKVYQIFK